MEDELKQVYQGLKGYLRKKWKKIVSWIVFIFGIYSVVGGFFVPVNFIWGIPLTIVGAFILKDDLKKIGSFLKPYIAWVAPFGPTLLVLGIIFLVAGIFSPFFPLFGWGILFIILGIPLTTARLILKHHVIEDWGYLIEGAKGKAEEIFKGTEDFLKKSGVSSIKMKRQELMPGIIRGLLGVKRKFLVVNDTHFRLKPYQFLMNAKDYGNNLDVVWYLSYRLSIIRALLSIIPFVNFIPRKLQDLDLFDLQDLSAFVTVCHHSVLSAVEKLMISLNQDPSKIDRRSRGFLGIS